MSYKHPNLFLCSQFFKKKRLKDKKLYKMEMTSFRPFRDSFLSSMFLLSPFDERMRHFGKNSNTLFDLEPQTDIKETEEGYEIDVNLPGFDKKDILIQYNDNNYISVIAQKEENKIEENDKYVLRERHQNVYKRSFRVGFINQNAVKAALNNGVLHLSILKENQESSKRITIE